jgi:hypothetical protein
MRQVIGERAARLRAQMSDGQTQILADFYQAVEGWRDGLLDLEGAMAETISGYVRCQCIQATSPEHPLYATIIEFLDAIWALNRGPGLMTRHGFLPEDEIQAQGGKLVEVWDEFANDMTWGIAWPTSYEMTIDGKKDVNRPIYAKPPKLRPDPQDLPAARVTPKGYETWNPDPEDWLDLS